MVPEKSLGTGIVKIWYWKKVSEPVSKNLVPKNVPVSVSEIFGTGKKYRYRLKFWVPSHTDCLTLREEGGRDGLEELATFEKTRRRSVAQQQSLCGSALLLAALVTATILVTAFVISQISLATRVIVLNRFGCQQHGATWTRYSVSILSNTPFLLIKL